MIITILNNVGFCNGVEKSLEIVENNFDISKETYLLGMLVHNESVNNEIKKAGIKIISPDELKLFDKNNPYNKLIITTAHGTNENVINYIQKLGIKIIDTTCPIVKKNNDLIKRYYQDGFEIIYIGIKKHPESESVKQFIHIVETKADIDSLNITNNRIVVISQTTMTEDNINNLLNNILEKYPSALNVTSICPFVKARQDEVKNIVNQNHSSLDYYLVLGSKLSNNTKKLVEIIKKYTNNVYQISSLDDLYSLNLKTRYHIYITSGTSTPQKFVREVKDFLEKNYK